jgi:ATP-dependent DNA helicase RecQ
MQDIHHILKHYWGYEQFRALQEDIVKSVLAGNDTLALLPTGGGKSICFQVPAMAHDGICIVVSPLIALMKDQVENLKKRDIKAAAIYSGMPYRQINYTLDNCIHGDFKFLYVSPERLKTDLFIERVKQMQVNLLAIDEAHCISQWGYDFRPEYLQIAETRELIGHKVPVLALTASATPKVVDDIQTRLHFKKKQVFVKSFERANISYIINHTEDKLNRLVHIIKKVPGTALVYVRNRKQTQEIAQWLVSQGIKADYYHAGLDHSTRNQKQDAWIKNKIQVMACTNAFGMGIDKPDVRVVLHIEIPDSLESYYQEAGRAGRDEKRSYCVLLFNPSDVHHANEKLKIAYPQKEVLIKTYQSICNYYSIPVGELPDRSYDLQLQDLCDKFKLKPIETYNSIKALEKCNLIQLSEDFFEPSKVQILYKVDALYRFQVEQPSFDPFIKLLLRSYGGIFEQFIAIDEQTLASRGKTTKDVIVRFLNKLHSLQIIDYQAQKQQPQIQFINRRWSLAELPAALKQIKDRQDVATEKLKAMIAYAQNSTMCRSKKLVAYFDQYGGKDCGICDVCIEQKKLGLTPERFNQLISSIEKETRLQPLSVKSLVSNLGSYKAKEVTQAISYLLDNNKLAYTLKKELIWNK